MMSANFSLLRDERAMTGAANATAFLPIRDIIDIAPLACGINSEGHALTEIIILPPFHCRIMTPEGTAVECYWSYTRTRISRHVL